jgi:hypothetical protein
MGNDGSQRLAIAQVEMPVIGAGERDLHEVSLNCLANVWQILTGCPMRSTDCRPVARQNS